jgi:hypothetical protein
VEDLAFAALYPLVLTHVRLLPRRSGANVFKRFNGC